MRELKQSDIFLKLENFKVMVQGKPVLLSDYEKINVKTISDILENEHKHNIIIHPGGSVIYLLTLIFSATRMCVYNMTAPENYILDTLKKDDIVLIDNKKARYKGIVNLDCVNGKKIALRFRKKGSMYYIPVEHSYKITPYKGNSENLNKMGSKKSTRKSPTKNIVSQLSGIDIQDMSGIFKYSSVIVCHESREIEALITDTEIVCDNGKTCFTNVYPSAYYSSTDKHRDFAGNISKAEPVLKFVSRISTAGDLIRSDKNIKNLLIFGEKIYKYYLGELDWLLQKKTLDNIIIILNWEYITNINYFLNNENDFKWYVWDKNEILNNVNLFEGKDYINNAYISREQDDLLSCFVDSETEVIKVEDYSEYSPEPLTIRESLYEVSRMNTPDEVKEEFLRISYSLLKLFEQSCFPLEYFEEQIKKGQIPASHPVERIDKLIELEHEFRKYILSKDDLSKLGKTISLIGEFREQLLSNNPKWDLLQPIICSNSSKKKAIVLCKSYYKNIIQNYIDTLNCEVNADLFSASDFYPQTIYDEIIFTGIHSSAKEKLIESYHGKKVIYLLYKSEQKIQSWKLKKNTNILNKIYRKNSFVKSEVDYTDDEPDPDINRHIDLDDLLFDLTRNKTHIQTSENYGPTVETYRTVIFNTGEIVYLTKYYRPCVVDITNQDIKDVTVEDLNTGDELVFVKDTNSQHDDIIMDIIGRLLLNEDFKNQYEEEFKLSKSWKDMLRKYMNENNYSSSDITVWLDVFDIKRHPATINNWLNNPKIIGPVEKEIYYALAQITDNKFFLKNWEKIYGACDDIRRLHTKLKKYLGTAIANRISGGIGNEFDNIIEEAIGDLTRYALVMQIEHIITESNIVPLNMSNKIIFD